MKLFISTTLLLLVNSVASTCVWTGPFKGEITPDGDPISDPIELEDAKTLCESNDSCIGVDSTWYIGTPFTARSGMFRADRGSYGVTYLKECKVEETERSLRGATSQDDKTCKICAGFQTTPPWPLCICGFE